MELLFDINRIVTPARNMSVLDALMFNATELTPSTTSAKHNETSTINDLDVFEVYSDTLNNPKNAVTMAAHIISLSSNLWDELNRLNLMVRNMSGETGSRFAFLCFVPCDFLIPRTTRYSLLNVPIIKPCATE